MRNQIQILAELEAFLEKNLWRRPSHFDLDTKGDDTEREEKKKPLKLDHLFMSLTALAWAVKKLGWPIEVSHNLCPRIGARLSLGPKIFAHNNLFTLL